MNRGGERLLRFAPVMTGSAQVSISLDLQVNNKHAPDSARFDLLVSVDGGAWESLAHVRGLYEDSVTASLTTNQSFQLQIATRGNAYSQYLTLDNLLIDITSADGSTPEVAAAVWIEDFTSLPYKATEDTGATAWKEYSDSHSYSGIVRDNFEISARRNPSYWESEIIDISAYESAYINAQVSYKKKVRSALEVRIDGGEWSPLWAKNADLNKTQSEALLGHITGDTMQLRFSAEAWTGLKLQSVDVYGLPLAVVVLRTPSTRHLTKPTDQHNPSTTPTD